MSTEAKTAGHWYRQGTTAYVLEHHGWWRGAETFRNRIAVHVQSATTLSAELEACAEQITEALNVTAETGLTPRQLAEQRAELLEALKECKRLNNMDRPINCTEVVNEAIAKFGDAP